MITLDLHIHQIIKTVACLFVFMLITSFTHAYAQSQQFVGQGSYTGTLNENRSAKVSAEVTNGIILHSFDITEASLSNHYYITGTLLNDSYGGVYDITLIFFWKDAAGNDLGTERVYTIVGLPASIRSSIFDIEEDYIPPLEKGYFHGLVEVPENANVGNSRYSVEWTWTLEAYINTSVRVLDNTVSISDVNFGYRDVMGTVHNVLKPYSKMSDKIIEELWQIKDSIAREHRYDIEALVAHLQNQKAPGRSASCGSTRDKMKE